MDGSKLTPQHRVYERGYILVIVTAAMALTLFAVGYVVLKTAANMEDVSRYGTAAGEAQTGTSSMMAQAISDVGEVSAANRQDFGVGQNQLNEDVSLDTNLVQGRGAAGTRNLSGRAGTVMETVFQGPEVGSEGYELIATPDGAYQIFGGRAQFVGQEITFDYEESNRIIDAVSGLTHEAGGQRSIMVYALPVTAFALHGTSMATGSRNVDGSILAENLTLDAATTVSQAATILTRITAQSGASVGAITFEQDVDSRVGASVAKRLEAGEFTNTPVLDGSISVMRNNGVASLVILKDMTLDAEGIPQMFRDVPVAQYTEWKGYILPAYQTTTRIRATLDESAESAVVSIFSATNGGPSGAQEALIGTGTVTVAAINNVLGVRLEKVDGRLLLDLNISAIAPLIQAAGANPESIYVDMTNSAGVRRNEDMGIKLASTDPTLGSTAAFSIVTPNNLFLVSRMNENATKPMSIFAPQIRFGTGGTPSVFITGQRGFLTPTGTTGNMSEALSWDATAVQPRQINLQDIVDPAMVPPVVIRGWLAIAREQVVL